MSKKTPDIRFKGFSEDMWEQRKLKELADFNPRSELPDEFEYVDLESVDGTTMIAHRKEKKGTAPSRAQRLAQRGDVFYQTVRPYQKNNYLYDLAHDNYVFSTGYAQMRPYIDSYFLLSYIQNERFVNSVLNRSTGTSYPAINTNDLADIDIKLPTNTKEQIKIGFLFKNIDNTIALHQRKLDLLNHSKKGFLQILFPKKEETVPEVRYTNFISIWKKTELGNLGSTFTGLSGKSREDFGHGEAEFITYKNVFNNPIADIRKTEQVEIDERQNNVQYGDILFTTSSETPHEVGMSSVWLDNRKNVYLNSFCFGFRPIEGVDYLFLGYYLRSSLVRKKISLLAQGISRYNISKNKMMKIQVQFPSIEEQQKIGMFFEELDSKIELQEKILKMLKKTKKSFLKKLFI